MDQDKEQEHNINCPTDKRTEKAHKKVPNPTPPHKIFDGAKPTNKGSNTNNKSKKYSNYSKNK